MSLDIPKRQITIFTGVSGSGKSSIAFDTIATEAQRQLFENFSMFVRTFLPKYPQPDADVFEHNLDLIRQADGIVDMGPDGGTRGGEVVLEGTPAALREAAHAITGQFLK